MSTVNGLRLPDSQVGGHNATLLAIGKNLYGPVDGGHAVQQVGNRVPPGHLVWCFGKQGGRGVKLPFTPGNGNMLT